MAKVLQANGSKGHHRFTLTVNEASTSGNSSFMDYSFTISPIQSGWDWYNWGSQISYSITIGDNTYTGIIPNYNGSSTITLSSGSNIEIPHNADGTKTINISFNVIDGTGQNYTCGNASASDTYKLTDLHKAPDITNCTITSENNTQLTNLGLATGTIAQFLSQKTFNITATFYDDATATNYSIYHNNVLIGTSNTNTIIVNFADVAELQTTLNDGVNYVGLTMAVTDSKNGYITRSFNFPVIKYTRPTIEVTSSSIKRKTTGGTTLTESIATLTFVGTCYKGNDVIGNNNTPLVQYKIWNDTEPNYSNVTTPSTADITITGVDINNINYLKVYDYKIKISDTFINIDASPYVKTDKVPTGVSVWSEYKDHVDFLKLTVGKDNPFEYSNEETICGVWVENGEEKPIYRKVFTGTSTNEHAIYLSLTNMGIDKIVNFSGWVKSIYNQLWPISNYYWDDSNYRTSTFINQNQDFSIDLGDYFSYPEYRIILEYTKNN